MSDYEDCELNNPNEGARNLCTHVVEYLVYGFNVRVWTAVLFTALFGLSAFGHFVQAIFSKRWAALLTVFACAFAETVGWASRLWSAIGAEWHEDLGGYWWSPLDAFKIQVSLLIISPAFLAAYWYILLGQVIVAFGPQYGRFNPKAYSWFFVAGDLLSLAIQALGGSVASSADDTDTANKGAHIMVAGVLFQMAVMTLFCFVLIDFAYHYIRRHPVKPFRFRKANRGSQGFIATENIIPSAERSGRLMVIAIIISTFCVYVRSVYRDIELFDGWEGPVITNQTLFDTLDGLMVFLALLVFNIIHPVFLWPKQIQLDLESPKRSLEKRGQRVSRF